jgi:ribonuclease E
VVTDAAGQVDDVGDFDWFLDGERATAAAGVQTAGALAAVEVTEVAAPGDSIEVAVASTEGDGAAVSLADSLDAVEPAGLGDADSGEAAVTGGESATAVDAVAAEEAGPRRRTRRRAGSDESGDSEATAVRRTRRRVKLAEAGETAVVLEVAAEVAPEAAAEIMPEPVPEPVPESVPESVVDSLIVVESAGEAAEVASLDDGAAIAPTERLDEVPPAAPVIVVDAPLPAPTRESVDDGVAPIDSRPARRGWWSRA